ncbi:hypothetical protein [Rhizobium mongolense]|uniref:Uncharacterized protein n=2 Tax=Rhizobium mongolense TaxID=57676 RepID=A0ABR6IXH4_9HYPH|nr:hypothetical protein [Rhizobium mongolense]MBB4232617.1 hypothetical protein [Rhizobium mongolense]TVZ74848.1 hypothetical protein BCL32_0171 [Rhizobium mongolense USDA 1844]
MSKAPRARSKPEADAKLASKPKTVPKRFASFTLEKDPAICLVYHPRNGRGQYLAKSDYVALNAGGQLDDRARAAQVVRAPKICADGDSWINILSEISWVLGYEKTFFDIIEQDYYTGSVAWPGDTFEQMLSKRDYRQKIGSAIFDYFVFSGGGNDLLGGGALSGFLKHKSEASGSAPTSHLHVDLIKRVTDRLEWGYGQIADDVKRLSRPRNTRMLVHGYDIPTPRKDGIWLGGPFVRRGYSLTADRVLIQAILTYLVGELYDLLARVAEKKDNVTVVDLRGSVRGRWVDELHPREVASIDIASRFTAIFGPSTLVSN